MIELSFLETTVQPVLFVSDLHLSDDDPLSEKLFVHLLFKAAGHVKALYILGDLFEVWLGDDAITQNQSIVLDKMRQCAHSGTAIFVQHGNRDFLLGTGFEKRSGATLISDPCIIDLHSTTTLISHGDSFCTDDVSYQAFRSQVRNPDWQQQFLSLPLTQRQQIANRYRQESSKQTREKSLEIMDVNKQAIAMAFAEHRCTQIIHGHTHRPGIHYLQAEQNVALRFVLGDWQQGPVIAVSDGKKLRLITL